ncbi:MAG TPA: MarR family winged helix-turn-helix transcriptional regulator [Polyangia bacterium]|nr:MarR family winged helix-turn-helix transcriptional regulator [Polyangia bacterium]
MSKELAAEIATQCLASRVRRLERTVSRIYDGALRGTGITGPQLAMLVAVELAGPTTAAFVGARLNLEKSTVSRNLARLATAGLIETDGGLRITARGSATIRACHPLWRRAQQQLRDALGPRELLLVDTLSHEPSSNPTNRSSHGKRRHR